MAYYEIKVFVNMSPSFQGQLSNLLGNKIKYLPELKQAFIRPLIQIAVRAIQQEYIEEGVLDRLSRKCNISEESVGEYYAIVFTILSLNLRSLCQNINPGDFKHSLEELKLPIDSIEDLATVVYGQKKTDLVSAMLRKTTFYPHLISYKWRVDITISSSILNRLLEPRIIMEWIFNTGERRTFELSLLKFHQLRHAIASILVEMQILEQQSVSKSIHYT